MERDRSSHLFTVRIWLEEVDGRRFEWRGKLRHVLSDETYYFRDWPTLVSHLRRLSPLPPQRGPDSDRRRSR